MNTSDLDQLLDSVQYEAPEDFTGQVMQKIETAGNRRPSAANRYYRTGINLIAASLITLCLSLTPWMDVLMRNTENRIRFGGTADYSRAAGSIESIIRKIDSLLDRL